MNTNDHDKTTFEYKDAVGNQVKKSIIVFGKGSVELLIKWREAMEQLLAEQKVTEFTDKISAFNRMLSNPAKNVYNNGIQQFCLVQDARAVEARLTNPTAAPDYKESHNMDMNALGQITFSSKAYTIQRN